MITKKSSLFYLMEEIFEWLPLENKFRGVYGLLSWLWGRFLLQVLATFGSEGLKSESVKALVEGSPLTAEMGLFESWQVALNPYKLLNPFKWLEFIYYLLTRWLLLGILFFMGLLPLVAVATALAGITLVLAPFVIIIGAVLFPVTVPIVLLFVFLLVPIAALVTITLRLVYYGVKLAADSLDAIVNLITSPVASFLAPLAGMFWYRPYHGMLYMLLGLTMATPFILVIAFSATPLPASIAFLAPLAKLTAPVVSYLAGSLGMLATQILLGIALSLSLMVVTFHFYPQLASGLREMELLASNIRDVIGYRGFHLFYIHVMEIIKKVKHTALDILFGKLLRVLITNHESEKYDYYYEDEEVDQSLHYELYGYDPLVGDDEKPIVNLSPEGVNFHLKLFDGLGATNLFRKSPVDLPVPCSESLKSP